jgi:hypothetical protein
MSLVSTFMGVFGKGVLPAIRLQRGARRQFIGPAQGRERWASPRFLESAAQSEVTLTRASVRL